MNQRLKELRKKAIDFANKKVDPVNYDEWDLVCDEKFAKLIVQECAKINDEFVGRRIGEINLTLVYKERFGDKK